MNVRVFPEGGTWRHHIEQFRPRYGAHEDADPGEPPTFSSSTLETANQPSEWTWTPPSQKMEPRQQPSSGSRGGGGGGGGGGAMPPPPSNLNLRQQVQYRINGGVMNVIKNFQLVLKDL